MFLRIYQHLLPRAEAWRLTVGKTIRSFFEGLTGAPSDFRDFVDDVYGDLFPETTRELALWEEQFGIDAGGTTAQRRLQLAGAWQAQGGQSPRYLQDVMQAAGFTVYIHEWWSSTGPYVARDPRNYTEVPLLGNTQCGDDEAECGDPAAQCNLFLANEPGYLVNKDLNRNAPPEVPSDPDYWPYFLYWGGPNFGDIAQIPAVRREEFERLLLKICPAQQWLVTMVEYV